ARRQGHRLRASAHVASHSMSLHVMTTRPLVAALLALFSFGCETQGEIAQPGGRPPIAVHSSDAGGVVKRTVEQRSPFGNTSYPGNLLADGDFELTGRTGQMPWVVFDASTSGPGTLNYDTGGLCHSGVRCAVIASGDILIGYLSSPKKGTMDVSLWVAPLATQSGSPPPACNTVLVSIKDFNNTEGGTDFQSDTEQPANGWCHFAGSAPNYAERSPVMWVTIAGNAKSGARIDDGVVKPNAEGTAGRLPIFRKSSAAEAARVAFIGEYLRAHRRF
ncbi:MAG: hypothetical protein ABIP89_08065, partial [Polyangiaceae bacterium]